MLNTFLLNTRRFNTQSYSDEGQDAEANLTSTIAFDALDLNLEGFMVTDIRHFSAPARDFRTYAVPRADGMGIIGDNWRSKRIRIEGYITKDTNAELEAALDTLKQAVLKQSGHLDIAVAGTVRRYVATLTNADSMLDGREPFHATVCPFTLEFLCLTPFARSVNYNYATFEETDLDFDEEVVTTGTANAKAVITVNFSAASNVSKVEFTNTRTGAYIGITRSFAASDVLIINAEQQTVTVNGVAVDFDGVFQELVPGINSFKLALTATSASYGLTIKHKTTWY